MLKDSHADLLEFDQESFLRRHWHLFRYNKRLRQRCHERALPVDRCASGQPRFEQAEVSPGCREPVELVFDCWIHQRQWHH